MRNYSIDSLKFLCAVMIVFLHVDTPYREYILPITRSSVPCFFMISGFLIFSKNNEMPNRLIKRIKKISQLLLWTTVLFAIIQTPHIIKHQDYNCLSLEALAKFIFLNENPFGFHLWYISAYLYVLVIALFCEKYHLWKYYFYCILLLLLADLIWGKYSLVIWDKDIPYIFVRNFLCVGIPYFGLGILIAKYQTRICKIKFYLVIGGIVVTLITSIIENKILAFYSMNASRDHYISTTILSICLLIAALKFKQYKPNIISKLGENCSLYIYIFHPIWMMFFSLTFIHRFLNIWIGEIYTYFTPIIILIATIISINILRKFRIIRK